MSAFVDEAQLHVKAGDGGAGCVSTRREPFVEKGGPDGGDGGRGGDIWLVADRNTASLYQFRDQPFRRATDGKHGTSKRAHGHGGEDTIVLVPEGTVVRDLDGEVIADLAVAGQRWMAGRGGRGGRGNARFLTNQRRGPSFAEQGEAGEDRWYNLELKLMADVALVGYPNVGKSTLISVVSAAKPKIADYPFTTLEPNLGVVHYDDHEFVVADIPGLIEGASGGKGLGHKFLRHIERARVLCVLVDLAMADGTSPAEQERVLLTELEAYQPELLKRPRVVIGSRADMATPEAVADFDGLAVASVTRLGLNDLLSQLAILVDQARNAESPPVSFVLHRPQSNEIRVERIGDHKFEVLGGGALRAVAVNDLTNPDALAYVREKLAKLGVNRALHRAGARDSDLITIGAFTFEYEADN